MTVMLWYREWRRCNIAEWGTCKMGGTDMIRLVSYTILLHRWRLEIVHVKMQCPPTGEKVPTKNGFLCGDQVSCSWQRSSSKHWVFPETLRHLHEMCNSVCRAEEEPNIRKRKARGRLVSGIKDQNTRVNCWDIFHSILNCGVGRYYLPTFHCREQTTYPSGNRHERKGPSWHNMHSS